MSKQSHLIDLLFFLTYTLHVYIVCCRLSLQAGEKGAHKRSAIRRQVRQAEEAQGLSVAEYSETRTKSKQSTARTCCSHI